MEKLEAAGRFAVLPIGLFLFFVAFVTGLFLAGVFLAFGAIGFAKLRLANRKLRFS